MPALLEIPRELRDRILSLVIACPTPAPQDASNGDDRTELADLKYKGWFGGKNVKYAKRLNRTDAVPTLLVNHQLHAETMVAIKHLSTRHCYVLDVMIVEETELWPTWLCVPELTTGLENVHATFRIIGTSKNHGSGFTGGCGGPPLITWSFYNLLERFLKVGPLGHQEKDVDKRIGIKILEIDVRTPDVPEHMIVPKDMRFRKHGRGLAEFKKETGIDFVMHPQRLLNFIISYIEMILVMSYPTAEFGGILYERIGCIKVLMDGEVYKEWDLATALKEVQVQDSFGGAPREHRPVVSKNWKENAYKTRVELGLPIVPLEGEQGPASGEPQSEI